MAAVWEKLLKVPYLVKNYDFKIEDVEMELSNITNM